VHAVLIARVLPAALAARVYACGMRVPTCHIRVCACFPRVCAYGTCVCACGTRACTRVALRGSTRVAGLVLSVAAGFLLVTSQSLRGKPSPLAVATRHRPRRPLPASVANNSEAALSTPTSCAAAPAVPGGDMSCTGRQLAAQEEPKGHKKRVQVCLSGRRGWCCLPRPGKDSNPPAGCTGRQRATLACRCCSPPNRAGQAPASLPQHTTATACTRHRTHAHSEAPFSTSHVLGHHQEGLHHASVRNRGFAGANSRMYLS
jgi:hypothetical protein